MSGVRILVDVDDRVVRDKLRELGRLAIPRRTWNQIGQILVTSTVDRFERGVGPDGVPWRPSARASREGGVTLVDTARLRGSIAHRASADGVEVGTNVVYAAIHQFGSRAGGKPRNIPARPYLGVDDDDREAIREAVGRAVARELAP